MTALPALVALADEIEGHRHETRREDAVALIRQAAAELCRLHATGDQMYRAITYTSGVDLNFAADEWKKARKT